MLGLVLFLPNLTGTWADVRVSGQRLRQAMGTKDGSQTESGECVRGEV